MKARRPTRQNCLTVHRAQAVVRKPEGSLKGEACRYSYYVVRGVEGVHGGRCRCQEILVTAYVMETKRFSICRPCMKPKEPSVLDGGWAGVFVDRWCDGVDLAVSPWTGCRPSARRCYEARPQDVEIRSLDCIAECRCWSSMVSASQAASSNAAGRVVRCTCFGVL